MSGSADAAGRRILFLSHSHPFGAFRVGSHHYARTLARAGAEVVHLSTPISLAHRVTGRVDRAAMATVPRGALVDADGVTWVVPRTVLPRPYGRFRVARALSGAGLGTAFDAVLIDQPLLWDDTVRALAPRLVYRPTDLYPDGVKAQLQREIVAASDGVVATSTEVLRGLGAVSGVPLGGLLGGSLGRSLVLENGVEFDRFAGSSASSARPAVCVYVGALDGRFDRAQVYAWARAHPDVRFIIAGPGGAAAASPPSNVEMLGPVSYDALPQLLQSARVGLLPLSDDPLNAGRSPMKLYEYLAAGLSVISRETPVIGADEDAGVFVYRGDDATGDAALRRALEHDSPNRAGVRRAASGSWDAKAESLSRFLWGLNSAGL